MSKIEVTFDIEDLSLLLKARASEGGAPGAGPMGDIGLSVIVDPTLYSEPDPNIQLHDTLTNRDQSVYRSGENYLLRYRLAVLGIGQAVEEVFGEVRSAMEQDLELALGELNLLSRFETALFGGRPRGDVVQLADASALVDRLIHYRPNYLVLVNAGQVKEHFARKTPRQLALITHQVNQGAMSCGQRPYTVVFVTDLPIPNDVFSQYWRLCQTMNTFPAAAQFSPDRLLALADHARSELRSYTELYFQVKRSSRVH